MPRAARRPAVVGRVRPARPPRGADRHPRGGHDHPQHRRPGRGAGGGRGPVRPDRRLLRGLHQRAPQRTRLLLGRPAPGDGAGAPARLADALLAHAGGAARRRPPARRGHPGGAARGRLLRRATIDELTAAGAAAEPPQDADPQSDPTSPVPREDPAMTDPIVPGVSATLDRVVDEEHCTHRGGYDIFSTPEPGAAAGGGGHRRPRPAPRRDAVQRRQPDRHRARGTDAAGPAGLRHGHRHRGRPQTGRLRHHRPATTSR